MSSLDACAYFGKLMSYVRQSSERELIETAFVSFFERSNRKFDLNEDAAKQFDARLYKEFAADSGYFIDSISEIKKNIQQYEWLFSILRSEQSKYRLYLLLSAKLFIDQEYLLQAYEYYTSQYFSEKYYNFSNEVLVDGGAFNGDTALEFMNVCPNFEMLYLFEPYQVAAKEARILLTALCEQGKVEIQEKALSSRSGTLFFNPMQGQGDSQCDKDGMLTVDAITLDEAVDRTVTFIKLDIEGMEQEALSGAKEIIRRDNPKMAICVYHKPGDFWRITRNILNYNTNYQFELAQCMPHEFCDTILYCIPTGVGKRDEIKRDAVGELLSQYRTMLTKDRTSFIDNLIHNAKEYKSMLVVQNERLTMLADHSIEMTHQQNRGAKKCDEQTSTIECRLKSQADELVIKQNAIIQAYKDRRRLERRIEQLEEDARLIAEVNKRYDDLNCIIVEMQASLSWRITKPLRSVRNLIYRITGK